MTIVSGVKGLTLTLDPLAGAAGNLTTLTGSTVELVITNGPDGSTRSERTATVAVDGLTASYVTDGTEFPIPGAARLQLTVSIGGSVFYSVDEPIAVSPRI